ncbi:MAG: hypothetical protein GKS01_12560 [Alphaproteobacteria bacterium]|nr:hypothetical protein [Alphaproteobacteria bacterium]
MLINRLNGQVGQGLENDPSDVMTVKHLLEDTGHLEHPDEGFSPFFDKPTEDGIFNIQDENGLKLDGILGPNGPTERTLLHQTGILPQETGFKLTDLDLTGPVGNGLENNSRDVQAVANGLKSAGLIKFDKTPVAITKDVDNGLQNLQVAEGLVPDGTALPGGPTEHALKRRAARNLSKTQKTALPPRNSARDRSDLEGISDDIAERAAGREAVREAQTDQRNQIAQPVRDLAGERKDLDQISDDIAEQSNRRDISRITEKRRVQQARKAMQQHLRDFQQEGLADAFTNLEHFLSGKGTPKTFTREQARTYKPIANGEKVNRGQFKRTFVGDTQKKTAPARKLKKLEDGETLHFPGNWDADHKIADFIDDVVGRNRNFALGFGRTKFTSNGDFIAKRTGDRIEISGTVTHKWSDDYDFHEGQPGSDHAKSLIELGDAKEFSIAAEWKQKVTATVRVKENGELEFENDNWTDVK